MKIRHEKNCNVIRVLHNFVSVQGSETNFSVNPVSTVTPNLVPQNSYKNQTSAVQTQTQTSTTAVTTQNLNPNTPVTVQNSTATNYMNNLTVSNHQFYLYL